MPNNNVHWREFCNVDFYAYISWAVMTYFHNSPSSSIDRFYSDLRSNISSTYAITKTIPLSLYIHSQWTRLVERMTSVWERVQCVFVFQEGWYWEAEPPWLCWLSRHGATAHQLLLGCSWAKRLVINKDNWIIHYPVYITHS